MSTNGTFAMAFKFHTLGYSVIPSGGGNKKKRRSLTGLNTNQGQIRHKSALMTLRYLKTISADESLRIQQEVEYQW